MSLRHESRCPGYDRACPRIEQTLLTVHPKQQRSKPPSHFSTKSLPHRATLSAPNGSRSRRRTAKQVSEIRACPRFDTGLYKRLKDAGLEDFHGWDPAARFVRTVLYVYFVLARTLRHIGRLSCLYYCVIMSDNLHVTL